MKPKTKPEGIESLPKKKRQAMAERLERIRLRNAGILKPDDVIKDARDPKSPLHDYPGWGGWDDEKAAMEHYRTVARRIISGVYIEQKTETRIVSVPRYVRDPASEPEEQGYAETLTIKDDKELSKELLREEFQRVRALLERACDIADVIGLGGELKDLLKRVLVMQQKVAA